MFKDYNDKFPPYNEKKATAKEIQAAKAAVFARIGAETDDNDIAYDNIGGSKAEVYYPSGRSPMKIALTAAAAAAMLAVAVPVGIKLLGGRSAVLPDSGAGSSVIPSQSGASQHNEKLPALAELADMPTDEMIKIFRGRTVDELIGEWGEPSGGSDTLTVDGSAGIWRCDGSDIIASFTKSGKLYRLDIGISSVDISNGTATVLFPSLEEAAAMTDEELSDELAGIPAFELTRSWGTPAGELSGMYGSIWAWGDRSVTVYYDHTDNTVSDVRTDSGSDHIPDNLPTELAEKSDLDYSGGFLLLGALPEQDISLYCANIEHRDALYLKHGNYWQRFEVREEWCEKWTSLDDRPVLTMEDGILTVEFNYYDGYYVSADGGQTLEPDKITALAVFDPRGDGRYKMFTTGKDNVSIRLESGEIVLLPLIGYKNGEKLYYDDGTFRFDGTYLYDKNGNVIGEVSDLLTPAPDTEIAADGLISGTIGDGTVLPLTTDEPAPEL